MRPFSRPGPVGVIRTALVASLVVLTATALGGRRAELDWLPSLAVHELRLQSENVIGVWYASMVFLGAAILFAAAMLRAHQEGGAAWKVGGWAGLTTVMALLSFDELGSLHERLGMVPGLDPFGGLGWIGVFAVPGAVVAIGIVSFSALLAHEDRTGAGLILAGVLLLATVPVQEWMEFHVGRGPGLGALLEEGTELAGSLLFLGAGLSANGAGGRRRVVPLAPPEIGWSAAALGLVAVAGLGAAAAAWGVGFLPGRGGLGEPSHWFVAAPPFLAGALLLFGGSRAREAGRVALGILMMAMSADAGAAAAISDEILVGSPDARLAADVALIAAGAGVAALLIRGRLLPPVRLAALLVLALAWVVTPVPAKWLAVLGASAIGLVMAAEDLGRSSPSARSPG